MAKRVKKYSRWLLIMWISVVILLIPAHTGQAAITKTENTQTMEWTKITNTGDAAGIKATSVIDISGSYATVIHIDWCLAEAQAHEGTEIIVLIGSEAAVFDAWTTIASFVTTSGTPLKADFANQEAAAQTVLGVTDPTTNNIDQDGKFVFLEDTVTPGNCEIAYQIDNSADAGDTITVLHGITAQKETTSDVWSMDGAHLSVVDTYAIPVPASASQAIVIFNNYWDDDGTGADGYGRVRVTKLTAL